MQQHLKLILLKNTVPWINALSVRVQWSVRAAWCWDVAKISMFKHLLLRYRLRRVFLSLKINPSAELLSQRHAWVYFHFPNASFDNWGRITVNCKSMFDRRALVLCLPCGTSRWECSGWGFLAGGRSLAIQGLPPAGHGEASPARENGAASGFWVVLCSFCVVGVFKSHFIWLPPCQRWGIHREVLPTGLFSTLCLCGFVLFSCSRNTQPSVPVSALRIPQGTGLLLQSQGHKKSIAY